jgi:hypothetical protein
MKKSIVALGLLLFISESAFSSCSDRYYYYRPTLTVTAVKSWQIYEEREFINSKEVADITRMVKSCGPAIGGGKYNFLALTNIIVPANFYKLSKPLYNQPNIRLPNGVDGGKGAYIDIPRPPSPASEQAQYTGEVTSGGNVGMVLVYLVREGVDELKTPDWYYKKNKYLQKGGYSFTEYKR